MNNQLIGITGEYFVATKLSELGFAVGLTMKHTPFIDILCTNTSTLNSYSIQVKTSSINMIKNESWVLSKKCENLVGDSFFYVFVNISKKDSPEFFIVPSREVAKKVKDEHNKWLSKAGKNHKDNNVRTYSFVDAKQYLDKWDLLK